MKLLCVEKKPTSKQNKLSANKTIKYRILNLKNTISHIIILYMYIYITGKGEYKTW